MKNYGESVQINHNPNWLYIPNHHRILIIGGSGSAKTNVLLNLINTKNQILTKIHLNYLSMEEKKQELKKLKKPKAF